jgi:hypothetical protein
MVDELNEYVEPDRYKKIQEMMHRNMRKILMRNGYEGESLEDRIKELMAKSPSPKIVNAVKTIADNMQRRLAEKYKK